ncbi:DNA/RNA non-specific endonuclease [Mucilaginibacter ginsenosidivorans]
MINRSLRTFAHLLLFVTLGFSACQQPQKHTKRHHTYKRRTEARLPRHAGDDNNMLLGNPSLATNDIHDSANYLIDHKYYIESYNRSTGEPNWVSWHLCAGDIGAVARSNDFRPDTTLPRGWFAADNAGYRGSGFDKGHNCPSGDRTASAEANSSTFLMDNIIPQAKNNNQHTWEHFESYCREKVRQGNEVYIIMGCYGKGGTGRLGYRENIADGHIRVPAHIWKIALVIPDNNDDLDRIDAGTDVIAIDTPNDEAVSPDWRRYVCTVSDIERATGYRFFTTLPATVREPLGNKQFADLY